MTGKVSMSYSDYGGEKSNFSYNTVTINAANIAAQDAAITALKTAIGNVTIGLNTRDARMYSEVVASGNAASPNAQRELKWLAVYTDDVTAKTYRMEIPCPLLNANTLGAGGLWNSSDLLWTQFKTDFENVVVSVDGNAVTLTEVRLVGRNL